MGLSITEALSFQVSLRYGIQFYHGYHARYVLIITKIMIMILLLQLMRMMMMMNTIVITFYYNARSDWLKTRASLQNRTRVDDNKLAFKFLLRNFDKLGPN